MTTVTALQSQHVSIWRTEKVLLRMKVTGVNCHRFVRLVGCPILLIIGFIQVSRCTPPYLSTMLQRVVRDGHDIGSFLSLLRGSRTSLYIATTVPNNGRVESGQHTKPLEWNTLDKLNTNETHNFRYQQRRDAAKKKETRSNAAIRHRRLQQSTHVHQHDHHSIPVNADGLPGNGRPIMYTFYTYIDNRKETGMSNDANQRLIEAWKEEWNRHGCETQVLGVETAQRHSDFQRYNAMLDALEITTYERYCFLRYLAMAVVSGGWMCDYDTFPLHPHDGVIPNDGKLTVHEYSKNGGVPSLVSGSKEEFNRIAKILFENAVQHKRETHWSDMFALHDVYKASGGTLYIRADPTNVVPGQVITKQTRADRICKRTTGKYAIHFSHYAMEFGGIPGAGPEQRAIIAQTFLAKWRSNCVDGEADAG
jgi:hypothetical protein